MTTSTLSTPTLAVITSEGVRIITSVPESTIVLFVDHVGGWNVGVANTRLMALTSSVPGVKKDILYGGKGPPPDYVKNSKVGLIPLALI